jgi:hypothetical protein
VSEVISRLELEQIAFFAKEGQPPNYSQTLKLKGVIERLTRERESLQDALQEALTAWYNGRACDLAAWEERFPFLRDPDP